MTQHKELVIYKGFIEPKTLPKFIDTIQKRGNKITVYSKEPGRIEAFDNLMWSYEQLSFTPHLTEKDDNLAETPIVLVSKPINHNSSNILVLLDHEMPAFECVFEKIVLMVDKSNTPDIQKVNKLVEELKSSGITITQYEQSQAGAQWQKVA